MLVLASMLLATAPMCWAQEPPESAAVQQPPPAAAPQAPQAAAPQQASSAAEASQARPAQTQQQRAATDAQQATETQQRPAETQQQQAGPPDRKPGEQARPEAPAPDQTQRITIPVGTRIALTLANPINPKAARRGDSLRAVTAFPVAVNDQVAIPAGVFVEGVIEKLVKKDRYGHPWVKAHFMQMVFPNGYVLRLEGESTEARIENPGSGGELTASLSAESGEELGATMSDGSGSLVSADPVNADEESGTSSTHENGPSEGDAFQFQQPPTLPPLPPLPKPNYGPAIAIGVGGAAAAVVIAVIAYHHRYDYFWYDAGWQFDMVLQSPLTLDATAAWNPDVAN
jgi:hypothetical protein